ncbi:MAG: hypothetical protein WC721_22370 [Victivallaceae bacterium]
MPEPSRPAAGGCPILFLLAAGQGSIGGCPAAVHIYIVHSMATGSPEWGPWGTLSPANAGREMIVQNGFIVVPSVPDGAVPNGGLRSVVTGIGKRLPRRATLQAWCPK